METASAVSTLIILIVLYFFPALVAKMRDHEQTLAIFMLNLLLGWSGLGWCAALIWACTEKSKKA